MVTAIFQRGHLPWLAAQGHRLFMWDFVASWARCADDPDIGRHLAQSTVAANVIDTPFTTVGEWPRRGCGRGSVDGPRPGHDYGLLAAWAAAALAEDIRVGKRAADFVALAEEALVVQVLSDAGMTVHDGHWVSVRSKARPLAIDWPP